MSELLLIQNAGPPSTGFLLVLLGVAFVTAVVGWLILRPYRKWVRSRHSTRTNVIWCAVAILWGSGLWMLIITQHKYDNTGAVIAGSILVCCGVFSLIRTLVRRA